jgi:hypothetical protein
MALANVVFRPLPVWIFASVITSFTSVVHARKTDRRIHRIPSSDGTKKPLDCQRTLATLLLQNMGQMPRRNFLKSFAQGAGVLAATAGAMTVVPGVLDPVDDEGRQDPIYRAMSVNPVSAGVIPSPPAGVSTVAALDSSATALAAKPAKDFEELFYNVAEYFEDPAPLGDQLFAKQRTMSDVGYDEHGFKRVA